jgi:hypothetical protein
MHDCKGYATVKLVVRFPVSGQFNINYKSGVEVLEDEACDELIGFLPQEYNVEVEDVTITNYEHSTAEREVDRED